MQPKPRKKKIIKRSSKANNPYQQAPIPNNNPGFSFPGAVY